MSKNSRLSGRSYPDPEKYLADEENQDREDEESILELAEIAILGSSKASLKYRSSSNLNTSRRSIYNKAQTRSPSTVVGGAAISKSTTSFAGSKLLQDKLEEQKESEEIDDVDRSFLSHLNESLFQFRGYFLGIIASFLFSLSHILMRRAKWLAGSDHSTIRYFVSFIFLYIYMKYKNIELFPKNKLGILFLRGLLGSFALISSYFALMFASPSDVVTLIHTSIVITALLSRIFFKEKLTIAHFFATLLSFVGIIFISKPAFIFPRTKYAQLSPNNKTIQEIFDSITNCTQVDEDAFLNVDCFNVLNQNNLTNQTVKENTKASGTALIGVVLSFCTAVSVSCVYLLIKKLCNSKVHWATSSIYVCWFGFPFSIVISAVLIAMGSAHKNFKANNEQKDLPMDIFYSVMSSCLSLSAQILLNIALKYEDATKIAITKTIDVLFSAILQYLILDISLDSLNIIGAISILTGTFFVLMFKILENKYDNYRKSQQVKDIDENNNSKNNKAKVNDKTFFTSNNNNDTSQHPMIENIGKKNINNGEKIDSSLENKKSSVKDLILRVIFVKI
jgi:drug/metabolite transporter (DMT)-like permease